jgi:hypothetical protein
MPAVWLRYRYNEIYHFWHMLFLQLMEQGFKLDKYQHSMCCTYPMSAADHVSKEEKTRYNSIRSMFFLSSWVSKDSFHARMLGNAAASNKSKSSNVDTGLNMTQESS